MRHEKIFTVTDRGNELTFKVKEMPARKLESWLIRAGLLLVSSGAFDSKDVTDAGDALRKAGTLLSKNGISALANIDYEKAQPLIDELLTCCYNVVDSVDYQITNETIDGIIEDVKTLFQLQKEALLINVGFFLDEKSVDVLQSPIQSQAQSKRKISVRS